MIWLHVNHVFLSQIADALDFHPFFMPKLLEWQIDIGFCRRFSKHIARERGNEIKGKKYLLN